MFDKSNPARVRTASTGLVLAALMASGDLIGGVPASAGFASPAKAAVVCGFFPVGMYRHCDNGSGSTVGLDVQDIFFNIHKACVGPGVHDLQPGIRWRVIDAWWNGQVGCFGFPGSP